MLKQNSLDAGDIVYLVELLSTYEQNNIPVERAQRAEKFNIILPPHSCLDKKRIGDTIYSEYNIVNKGYRKYLRIAL